MDMVDETYNHLKKILSIPDKTSRYEILRDLMRRRYSYSTFVFMDSC